MQLSDQEIGKRIKHYRKGIMTQRELAQKIGKTESSIRKYEKGLVTIPLDVLERIAAVLDTTPFCLMGADYWGKKYPEIAEECEETERFIDFLGALGYTIKDISNPVQIPIEEFRKAGKMELVPKECEKSGFVMGETHSIELFKDGKSVILEESEFSDMVKDAKSVIELRLWQKSQEGK